MHRRIFSSLKLTCSSSTDHHRPHLRLSIHHPRQAIHRHHLRRSIRYRRFIRSHSTPFLDHIITTTIITIITIITTITTIDFTAANQQVGSLIDIGLMVF
jgi:hypothetical protein